MRYLGGKQRLAKKICGVIQPSIGNGRAYVEPFVGAASVMAMIKADTRIGADINEALITMWKALDYGWSPPENVSESLYKAIKRKNDPKDPLTSFVGFGCSFAGKFFGGFARGATGRNYAKEAASLLRKKLPGLAGVNWVHCDYRSCPIPERSVIYCDPPYAGTTKYSGTPAFNHGHFWNWCRMMSGKGHSVFISEYNAPEDFVLVAEFETKLDMHSRSAEKECRTERIFTPDV